MGGSGSSGPDTGAAARAVPPDADDASPAAELLVTRGKRSSGHAGAGSGAGEPGMGRRPAVGGVAARPVVVPPGSVVAAWLTGSTRNVAAGCATPRAVPRRGVGTEASAETTDPSAAASVGGIGSNA